MTPAPPAPDTQQPEQPQNQGGVISKMNEASAGSQNLETQGLDEMQKEVGRLGDSALKIAKMAEVAMPSLMVHVAKLVEIGKAIQSEVQTAVKSKSSEGAQPPSPPAATSPTDAPAAT